VAALLAGITVSTYRAIAASRETDMVKAEQQRVLDEQRRAVAAGALEITDTSVPHIRRVRLAGSQMGSTAHFFQWRVYLPLEGNYRLVACLTHEFKQKPPHEGFLLPIVFKENQRGREVLVSLALWRDEKGRWTISQFAEGDPIRASLLVPLRYAEPFDWKAVRELHELAEHKTYRLPSAEDRINLLSMVHTKDDFKTYRSGKAKFSGLQVVLERAGPDGTFAIDAEVR
jgi:hypothetical protein